jgi:hypothetical protein
MTHEIHLRDEFGPRLSDGSEAYRFRVSKIDPYLAICEQVVLDFTGVRSANSSFVNALVSGLFEQHGAQTLGKLVFRGCLPTIQVLVQSAVDLGIIKHAERATTNH